MSTLVASNPLARAALALAVLAVLAGIVLYALDAPRRARARTIDAALATPAEDVPAMESALRAIDDPVVRQSVLLEWVRLNRGRLMPMSATPLCETLDAAERVVCLRRVGSPHLMQGSGP